MSAAPTSFEGTRCLVTGTASGVGASVARLLGDAGAQVFSIDLDRPKVPVHRHFEVDLADLPALDRVLAQLPDDLGVVCNVAALAGDRPEESVFRVNFLAPRYVCESLIPRLRPGGALVNVASTASHDWPKHLEQLLRLLADPGIDAGLRWFAQRPAEWTAAAVSEEALAAYTKVRGPELIAAGLRMNAVSPGAVDTPLLPDFRRSMSADYIEQTEALYGAETAENIARVVLFLASADAAAVNGHNIIADRGVLGRALR